MSCTCFWVITCFNHKLVQTLLAPFLHARSHNYAHVIDSGHIPQGRGGGGGTAPTGAGPSVHVTGRQCDIQWI